MKANTRLIVFCVLLSPIIQGLSACPESCSWEEKCQKTCDGTKDEICACLNDVKNCTDALLGACGLDCSLLPIRRHETNDQIEANNCTIASTPRPDSDSDSVCMEQIHNNEDEIHQPSKAVVNPTRSLVNALCPKLTDNAVRHCSLFTYSHLRTFGSDNVQTCSLPGSWYILHHPNIMIEAVGGIRSREFLYTKIDTINITLYSSDCTAGAVFNYVANADKDLPQHISSSQLNVLPLFQPLEFTVDSSRTTASILAPWINTTIVLRRILGYLSIVVQMPASLAFQSYGLCHIGCPIHTQHNINVELSRYCTPIYNPAINFCGINATLINSGPSSLNLVNACTFDILKSKTYKPPHLYRNMIEDYKALPNVGKYITPEPNVPPFVEPLDSPPIDI